MPHAALAHAELAMDRPRRRASIGGSRWTAWPPIGAETTGDEEVTAAGIRANLRATDHAGRA